MRSKFGLFLIKLGLISAIWTMTANAQGFSSIVQKLDQLEKRLNSIEISQSDQNQAVKNMRVQIDSFQPALASTQSDFPREEIVAQVEQLSNEVEQIKAGNGNMQEIEEVRMLALNLREMIEDMRSNLSQPAAATNTVQSQTVNMVSETDPGPLEDAGAIRLEVSADAAFVNKYVWRGILFTNGPVMQPSVTLGGGNFSFNVWASMDLNNANEMAREFNELDFTLDYSFSVKNYSISLGAIPYTFPNTGFSSTTELYFSLGADVVLSPSITVYRDIDEADGTYVSFGFGHSIPIDVWNTSLDLSTALGWGSEKHNLFYYGVEKNAGTDIFLGASMSFALNDFIAVSPSAGYAGLLYGDIRNSMSHKDNLMVGIAVSASY